MKSILFFLPGFLISVFSFPQAGSLDETFGDYGKIFTDLDGTCTTSALQADGKILAAGTSYLSGDDCIVVRYLPDGSIDSSFGQDGIVTVPSLFVLNDIELSGDGHILICGATFAAKIAAAKLSADGTLDSSFGNNGVAIMRFETATVAKGMILQTDGKIVLGGWINISENLGNRMLLVRLNTNGSLDEGFGDNGKVENSAGYQINCLALQDDGKIISGGQQWPTGAGTEDQFVISRYNTDGSLDKDFGNVFTDITEDGSDIPYALLVLSDGKIIATGIAHSNVGNNTNMTAVKYKSDGKLDESFGNNGISDIIFENNSSEARGLLLQPDGKLLLTGTEYNFFSGEGVYALVRLKPEGSLDSLFGINGKQTTEMNGHPRAYSSLLQDDGKIVLSGSTFNRHLYYALARYLNDAILPLHFTYFNASPTNSGGITLTWQTAQENNNNYFAVERSSNNNFNELTRINSQGNSSQAQKYSYTDNAPLQGTNFYRLKQVDKDGKFSYSQIVSATVQNGLTVVLFPNPVKDVLNIKGLDAGMSYELSVMSAKGSVVAKTSINNTSSYKWNLRSLSKGVYYLSVTSLDHKKTTVKFVKE